MKKRIFFTILACWLLQLSIAYAGGDSTVVSMSSPDQKGQLSLQLLSGIVHSPCMENDHRPTLNYSLSTLRLGYILTGPIQQKSIFRGNIEWLSEIVYAPVIKGPGDYMAGLSVLLRYNFLTYDTHLAPYFQIGIGMVYNDIHDDDSQRLIGQDLEFTPQASLGLSYFLNRKWAVNLEAIYHHISNAGLDDRNVGVNGLGGLIGVTYVFSQKDLSIRVKKKKRRNKYVHLEFYHWGCGPDHCAFSLS